jgi:predicted transcriptional regulator
MNHMATINVQESTFKAIKQIAERSGSVVAATVERALEQFIATEEMSD